MKNNILVWLVLAFGIGAALIGLSKVQDLRKGAFSSQGKVFFTPNDINVKAGEEFVIALSMDSKDQKVSGFRFIVKYPADLLEYVGSNYNLEYPLRFQGDSANKLTGEIDVVALGSGLAAESLPNGTWVLDTLKFKALKSGTTKFGVTSMDISRYDSANADNNLQINNETVNLVIAEADLPTVSGSISVDNKNVNGDYKVHYYWDLGSKRLSAANFSLSINYTGYPQNLWKNFGSQAGFSEFKVVEVSPGVKNIILADVRPYASLKTGKIELLSFEVPGITSLGGLPHYLLEILPGYQLVAGSETGQTVSLQMINNSWLIDSLAVPPTPTLVPTNSPVPTATNTPVPTATNTPAPTATNTPVPTATNTPLPTATNTPVPTATNTPVPTATNTPAPTATLTPTMTPTATPTPVPMCLVCGNGLLSKSLGNAHLVSSVNSTPYCDNSIDLLDFEVWRYEYLDANLGSSVVTRNDWRSDFSCSSTVGLEDFEIWRTNYFRFLGLEI